jgi:hypothetical protein
VTIKETPHGAATTRNPLLAQRRDDLVQRQVRLPLDQGQQPILMIFQRRPAAAAGLGRRPAVPLPALQPLDRCAGADLELLGSFAARCAALDTGYDSLTHIRRVCLWHRSTSRIINDARRLSHPRPFGNLPIPFGWNLL